MRWFWKLLIILLIIGLFSSLIYWENKRYEIPYYARHYQDLMKDFNSQEMRANFIKFHPEVVGMDYLELLDWLSYRLHYPKPDSQFEQELWNKKVESEGRPEDPVLILASEYKVTEIRFTPYLREPITILRALGRCGEFSLVYTQLLLINNYNCRLMMGYHSGGDHVWVEVNIITGYNSGKPIKQWITIDPTDACAYREYHPDAPWANCTKISASKFLWGDREWNVVWRITFDRIKKVTEEYNKA